MNTTMPVQPAYEVSADEKKRQQIIADAWKAYHGQLDKPLVPMPGEPDDNVMSNRCQPIVDRGVDFLFGKPLGITIEEGGPDEAQQALEDTWDKNEARLPLLQKLAMSGAVAGQAYLRIMPDNKGNFRLIVVDPQTVFVQTAPQDCETALLYCIEYSIMQKIDGQPKTVFYHEEIMRIDPDGNASNGMPDDDDTWTVQHWTRVGDRGPWAPAGDVIAWPYNFAPLFSNQNMPYPHSFYGVPDVTPDLIQANNSLNFVQRNISRVNKLYGQPIIWTTGMAESSIMLQPGRAVGLPPNATMGAVPITSDMLNALAFAADLRSDMDEQSAVPAVALGRMKDLVKGQISGVTMELMFMPLLEKTEKKRCLYGKLILDVSKALLILGGFSADIELSLQWQSPLPNDDLASVQAALAKQQLGVSNGTLIDELGYNPDQETDRNDAENAKAMTNFSRGTGMPPQQPAVPGQEEPQPVSPFIGGH
jgi:hypothetical protein